MLTSSLKEAASNALTGLPNRRALIADSDMLFTVAAARARDLRPGRLQAVPRPVRTRRRRHHARQARPAAPDRGRRSQNVRRTRQPAPRSPRSSSQVA